MENIKNFFEYLTHHNRTDVSIDLCHNILIFGLLLSLKPKYVLEIGIGGGYTTRALLDAIKYNDNNSSLTCVDNWHDWSGKRPPIASEIENLGAKIVEMDEKDFVEKSRTNSYDFVMVDGDHRRGGYWANKVYEMVNPNGIICVHDICESDYPTLKNYLSIAEEKNYSHYIFNMASRGDEQCSSGLLIVFKSEK